VSAVLHALSAMKQMFCFQPSDSVDSADDNDEPPLPCTSQPCIWKEPKARKTSNLRVSDAVFQKHDYSKPNKRKIQQLEDYDPRPLEFRGTASLKLPELLHEVKGKGLGVSLLLDTDYISSDLSVVQQQPDGFSVPNDQDLQRTIEAFKHSLEVNHDQARQIERDTREQRMSSAWFAVRRYRLTASVFGEVISRKPDTPPDKLVLRILKPTDFTSVAMRYGIDNEDLALAKYAEHQKARRHQEFLVTKSGFLINPSWPFLGASPDGAVYDPSDHDHPYGFLEIKCPYSVRDKTPLEAAADSSFYCTIGDGDLVLKRSHSYYSQIQGQMAIGERTWCDFVVYTSKGLNVQRIQFDHQYWTDNLPKLLSFYNNCIAPECVSPLHSVQLSVRKL